MRGVDPCIGLSSPSTRSVRYTTTSVNYCGQKSSVTSSSKWARTRHDSWHTLPSWGRGLKYCEPRYWRRSVHETNIWMSCSVQSGCLPTVCPQSLFIWTVQYRKRFNWFSTMSTRIVLTLTNKSRIRGVPE
uniref:Uncharacterized protein n=1 Tax=Cacopsylla melanoneura TaxID=428564 RepID=A0A8D8VWA7_9HEMI